MGSALKYMRRRVVGLWNSNSPKGGLVSMGSSGSGRCCSCSWYSSQAQAQGRGGGRIAATAAEDEDDDEHVSSSGGISRPLREILKELNKKVPDSLIKTRIEKEKDSSFPIRYVPWHLVNRILNLHAPEWSGEVRNITYSPDAKSVSVVYRVTLYGTDAEIFRESTGTASIDDTSHGDPVQKAEAMAFRRACARFGLALHLYHEDAS